MRRTNRVEPVNTGVRELTRAIMITTTQLEIIRRVEILPIVNQSIIDHVRCQRDRPRVSTQRSRKILFCISCLFITAGILVLSITTTGLIIIFKKMNGMKKINIERYDLGDLQYGVNNINLPLNTYLSNNNKISIQKYLSDQLLNEPGFRGLVIDGVFIQDKLKRNKRKQRDTSCSIIFILQNIQVYFDHCSICTNKRNLILHHLFFNITTFRQPFYLILNKLHIFPQICSIPNIFQSIISISSTITSTLSPLTTNLMDISTVVSTIETTSINNLEESINFTTDHLLTITNFDSSPIQETSSMSLIDTKPTISHTKTSDIFQFLPFRPSMTRRSVINDRQI